MFCETESMLPELSMYMAINILYVQHYGVYLRCVFELDLTTICTAIETVVKKNNFLIIFNLTTINLIQYITQLLISSHSPPQRLFEGFLAGLFAWPRFPPIVFRLLLNLLGLTRQKKTKSFCREE